MAKIFITPTNVELLTNGFRSRVSHNRTIAVFNKEGKTIEQFKEGELINSKYVNNLYLKELVCFDKNIRENSYNFLKYEFSIDEVSKLNKEANIQVDNYSFTDVLKFNSSQIDELMKTWNIENTKIHKEDFDGGNFSGEFDRKLNDMGYIRLCVKRESDNNTMIIVEKNKLDSLIEKNFKKEVLFECEKIYYDETQTSYNDLLESYYDVYFPVLSDLEIDYSFSNPSNNSSIYVDAIDYILYKCEEIQKNKDETEEESEDEHDEKIPFLENIVKKYDESQSKKTYINIIDKDASKGDSLFLYAQFEKDEFKGNESISQMFKGSDLEHIVQKFNNQDDYKDFLKTIGMEVVEGNKKIDKFSEYDGIDLVKKEDLMLNDANIKVHEVEKQEYYEDEDRKISRNNKKR